MTKFEYAVRATIGARDNQEDAMAVWPLDEAAETGASAIADQRLLAVLADGMGGHAAGALASTTVCGRLLDGFVETPGDARKRLSAALDAANAAVAQCVRERPELDGMGSTVIAASFEDGGLEWISVGDSPMYLVRAGEIAVLNEDHSLAPALDAMAAAGRITHEKALSDPRRHMLRSAVTGEDLELIDLSQRPLVLSEGDVVVLASDGIHTLPNDEIARIVSGYAADGCAAVAAALIRAVEAANEPHQDNTSVIVVRPLP